MTRFIKIFNNFKIVFIYSPMNRSKPCAIFCFNICMTCFIKIFDNINVTFYCSICYRSKLFIVLGFNICLTRIINVFIYFRLVFIRITARIYFNFSLWLKFIFVSFYFWKTNFTEIFDNLKVSFLWSIVYWSTSLTVYCFNICMTCFTEIFNNFNVSFYCSNV